MSGSGGMSRRGLFSSGVSRLVAALDEQLSPETGSEPDGDRYAARQAQAWDVCDDAGLWDELARLLVDNAQPSTGEHVLDVGAGTGGIALLAAQRSAVVTACDHSAALVTRGRQRTTAAGTDISWLRADMDALPFDDASFDRVLSGLAPMFCLRARDAIAELFRVVRPGGTVAFTVFTQGGVVGRLLRLAAAEDPPPPGVPTPLTWGREERMRAELELHTPSAGLELTTVTLGFTSHEQAVERLFDALGPLAAAPGEAVREEARAIIAELAGEAGGPVRLSTGCLLAVGRRPLAPDDDVTPARQAGKMAG